MKHPSLLIEFKRVLQSNAVANIDTTNNAQPAHDAVETTL